MTANEGNVVTEQPVAEPEAPAPTELQAAPPLSARALIWRGCLDQQRQGVTTVAVGISGNDRRTLSESSIVVRDRHCAGRGRDAIDLSRVPGNRRTQNRASHR